LSGTLVFEVFSRCVEAISGGQLITRESRRDKEFHFQDWFSRRLGETSAHFEQAGRNQYPDFSLVEHTEGYEIKGLAYPGREATYDANSQVPSGFHNGRTVFYVFGRYPKEVDAENEYPVVDLVVCHGDFLNAEHEYRHQNKSVKGFGSYGDIMIRDRKMYVVPTPFAVASGLNGMRTLILPWDYEAPEGFREVGDLVRREADELVVAYEFDLTTNEIKARRVENPDAGCDHHFVAFRLDSEPASPVELVERTIQQELE
jgi:hypothetical protein